VSSDYRTPVVEYHGQSPCIEPHILGRLLDKLKPLRAAISNQRSTADAWTAIDDAARNMEAAK